MLKSIEVIRGTGPKNVMTMGMEDCDTRTCQKGCFSNPEWYADTYWLHYEVINPNP